MNNRSSCGTLWKNGSPCQEHRGGTIHLSFGFGWGHPHFGRKVRQRMVEKQRLHVEQRLHRIGIQAQVHRA